MTAIEQLDEKLCIYLQGFTIKMSDIYVPINAVLLEQEILSNDLAIQDRPTIATKLEGVIAGDLQSEEGGV
jgi:hypothetical protein